MIPYFTPSTARRDIGRLVGDAELAKLANLNKLIEDINAIVAIGGTSGTSGGGSGGSSTSGTSGISGGTGSAGTNGTSGISGGIGSAGSAGTAGTSGTSPNPGIGPTVTYTVGGTLEEMTLGFTLFVNPSDIPISNSTKTVASTYGAVINIPSENNTVNTSLTSINFPDAVLLGSISIPGSSSLNLVGFPVLTKVLGGQFSITAYENGSHIIPINAPLLDYIAGDINFYYVEFDFPLLTGMDGHLFIKGKPSDINFPALTSIGDYVEIRNCASNSSISFPLITSLSTKNAGTDKPCFSLNDSTNVTNLDFPLLVTTTAPSYGFGTNSFQIEYSRLDSLNLPLLESTSNFMLNHVTGLTTLDLPSLVTCGIDADTFTIDTCSDLTTINIPSLIHIRAMSIYYCDALTSFSAPLIDNATNGGISITGCNSLTSVSLPNYTNAGQLNLVNLPAFTTLTLSNTLWPGKVYMNGLPNFTTGTFPNNYITVEIGDDSGSTGITNLNAPNATDLIWQDYRGTSYPTPLISASAPLATRIYFRTSNEGQSPTLSDFTSVNFPSVTYFERLKIRYSQITTVDVSTVVTYDSANSIELHNNPYLTSAIIGVIGTLKTIGGSTVYLSNNALTETCVNNVLALLVSLDGTNGTTEFGSGKTLELQGGTNAAPTGQGILDVATLQARGCTVTTN